MWPWHQQRLWLHRRRLQRWVAKVPLDASIDSDDTRIDLFFAGDVGAAKQVANTNKKQSVVADTDVKIMPVMDGDAGSDRDDEGQWVTQSNKQVSLQMFLGRFSTHPDMRLR